MTFIRIQNAKRDAEGNIIGGSASIVDSVYMSEGPVRCKQVMRESLGTIVFMDSRRSGIFMSKTRGLVHYDVDTDEFGHVSKDDPRIPDASPTVHDNIRSFFGDCDVVLNVMRDMGISRILRNIAVDDDTFYSKMVCHTLHSVLRDGSKIRCDRFIERSFVSDLIGFDSGILRTDTRYFDSLGGYDVKVGFFKRFVQQMRLKEPGFGRGCYVDSTPLPNSITDLPTNRMCSHGVDSVGIQTRLVLVLDIRTGYPVWFDIIPGNVLDLSTIMNIKDKVSRLIDVHIDDMVLDAGYVCREVIAAYNLDDNPDRELIARLPAKKGYGHDELFMKTHGLFSNAKYGFVRQDHTYFGVRREVTIFGKREYAYVYMDHENASAHYRDYLYRHADEYEGMSMREKNRIRYRGGFFVLVSNVDTTPERLLDRYYGRTEIETALNCGKEYLGMLPLNRHREETVNGKLMQDMVSLIVYLRIRKVTVPTGRSVSDYIYDLQSLDCYRSGKGRFVVNPANRQAKVAYKLFNVRIPSEVDIEKYRDRMLFTI